MTLDSAVMCCEIVESFYWEFRTRNSSVGSPVLISDMIVVIHAWYDDLTKFISVFQCRAAAVRPELPFPVAELPPPGPEARKFHAGGGEDHLRHVQQDWELVSLTRTYSPCQLQLTSKPAR